MFLVRKENNIAFAEDQVFLNFKIIAQNVTMSCKSHLYLTQSNKSVSNFDVSGKKDPKAALAKLLDSIMETPDQNYPRQCLNGMYEYQMGYTMFNVKEVDDLCKASCEPGSFDYVHLDASDGTFVKRGEMYIISNENKIVMILRTRSGHGPTLEINLCFPEPDKVGVIRKIRILGKLIVI